MKSVDWKFNAMFSRLSNIFWIFAACNSIYILKYVTVFLASPSESMSRGMSLAIVPDMLEHVLMSALMILLGNIAAEAVRKYFS